MPSDDLKRKGKPLKGGPYNGGGTEATVSLVAADLKGSTFFVRVLQNIIPVALTELHC